MKKTLSILLSAFITGTLAVPASANAKNNYPDFREYNTYDEAWQKTYDGFINGEYDWDFNSDGETDWCDAEYILFYYSELSVHNEIVNETHSIRHFTDGKDVAYKFDFTKEISDKVAEDGDIDGDGIIWSKDSSIMLGIMEKADEAQNATKKKYSFMECMLMTDDEFIGVYNTERLKDCGFGDDTIDNAEKFDKYLNTPPKYYYAPQSGTKYESGTYTNYKKFISGDADAYITFYVNLCNKLSPDLKSEDLGCMSNWEIELIDGKYTETYTNYPAAKKHIEPLHEYHVHIPAEVLSNFETYVRFEAASNYFSDIARNNDYGIVHYDDINAQYSVRLAGEETIDGNLAGDANLDGKTTVADAVAILQSIGNRDKYALTPQGLINADIDGYDGVTAKDALEIQTWDSNGEDFLYRW